MPGTNDTAKFIFVLFGFAAGFAVRPFGALFFGRLGDLIGRKYTFLVTMTIMGLATFVVGLLPGYQDDRLRGAGALHRLPPAAGPRARRRIWRRRDLCRRACAAGTARLLHLLDPDDRDGRPVPVAPRHPGACASACRPRPSPPGAGASRSCLSIILLGFSIWIRLQLAESPAFQKMKAEGTRSKAPLTEAFGRWDNAKIAIIALLGGTAGQAVVWYTRPVLRPVLPDPDAEGRRHDGEPPASRFSLLVGTPFFILFGWLSDKIGRKPILLAGCLIAAITYFPLFQQIAKTANPKLIAATETVKVQLTADPATCGSLFDPVGVRTFTRPCDVVRRTLATNSIHYDLAAGTGGLAPHRHRQRHRGRRHRRHRRAGRGGGAGGGLSEGRAIRRSSRRRRSASCSTDSRALTLIAACSSSSSST